MDWIEDWHEARMAHESQTVGEALVIFPMVNRSWPHRVADSLGIRGPYTDPLARAWETQVSAHAELKLSEAITQRCRRTKDLA